MADAPRGGTPRPFAFDGELVGEEPVPIEPGAVLTEPPVEAIVPKSLDDPVEGDLQAPAPSEGSFDPEWAVELPGERDRFRSVYENPDGTRSAVLTQEAQNFVAADGRWERIDPRLVPVKGQRDVWRTAASSVEVTVSAAGVSVRGEDGKAVSVRPGGAGVQLHAPVVSADGLTATFAEVWPGVDVRFVVSNASVRKEIVVKRADVTPTFQMAVSGVELVVPPHFAIRFGWPLPARRQRNRRDAVAR
ncbi:MAG TPA: hypothetical protein PLV68_15895 [Ilumatobacteraceae bacterium]|nr:hypothetical protein [Ilumatobacteraceae bacterium]